MPIAFLGLGSNLGDKRQNINNALVYIRERVGDVLALSTFYNTSSWGYLSDNDFLNAVVKIDTTHLPHALLNVLQNIESEIGRSKKTLDGKYNDRLIDIDILLYDDAIIDTPLLTIPHALMHQRSFVLQPLCEIAPDTIHPVLGKTIKEIYNKLASGKTNCD